tara:strand:+ start:615 stop:1634 length:1020 start_codon:yes stop_codon:yes gene_type:complete
MAYGKKEFKFDTHPLESFLFLDIETVRKVKELEADTPLYDSFVYKMRYAEEAQRKDFNEYNVKALFSDKAALYPEFGKVVCITVGRIIDGKLVIHSFNQEEEAVLLTKFNKALRGWAEADPNLAICGVNLKFFDLRYIFIRSIINQVEPVKGHINLSGLKPWEVFTADITDIWKQTSPYNAPLVCMAECLGLPSPKSDIDGSQVSDVYYNEGKEGLERITKYCERDVFTTANIAMRLRFQPLLELADPKEVVKAKEETSEAEPLPFLHKLYNMNHFDDKLEAELKEIIGKKRLTKADKENLKQILMGVYLRTDFINKDQDTKAIIEQKTEEIDNFINSL